MSDRVTYKNFLSTKYRFLFPVVHFLLSFIYERKILIFAPADGFIATIAKSQALTDAAERVMGYLIAKMFAFVFIFFIWKLLFTLVLDFHKTYIKIFAIILIVGSIAFAVMWPNQFVASEDNLITYSYALRLWPEYWHSAYSSIIFTACLMTVPFPWFISVFQWIFAVFTAAYVYKRISESDRMIRAGRYGLIAVFLMPGIFTLISNSYRTECYAILCTYLVSKVMFDIIDGKKASHFELFKLMLLCGLVAVWRSEGIILGLLLFGIYLIFVQKMQPVKIVFASILMVVVFVAVSIPQKAGDIKYYGKDYSFINSFPTLQNILNSEDANLSYEGSGDDLYAISVVTPIDILKKYGMDGYRRYNYANGRGDINQSLASDEVAGNYMSAYRNIVIHNPVIYAKTQVSMLLKMLMIKPYAFIVGYDAEIENDLEPWTLKAWDIGRDDIIATGRGTNIGTAIYDAVSGCFKSLDKLLTETHFYTLLLLAIPMMEVYILFKEIIKAIRNMPVESAVEKISDHSSGNVAGNNTLGLGGIAFVLLLQAAAIILVLPYSTLVYLHAYYYASFMFVYVYILLRRRKNEKI